MTRTAGAPIGCQRPSRFWGLGCPKIYHEVEDTLGASVYSNELSSAPKFLYCVMPQRTRNYGRTVPCTAATAGY
ncbi:hypothetical protein, partial [Thiolapillus sp.]|uniref:hypothetical protein n=1 Tax=Thiolapillus sp. TaxID=2017437 RepID=UPI003AF91AC0